MFDTPQNNSLSTLRPPPIFCRCLIDCPDGSDNSTCLLPANGKCFKSKMRTSEGLVEIRAGCLDSPEKTLDQCNKLASPKFSQPGRVLCCNNGSMCNDYLIIEKLTPVDNDDVDVTDQNPNVLVIVGCVVVFFFIFGCLISLYLWRVKRREKIRERQIKEENRLATLPMFCDGNLGAGGTWGNMSDLGAASSGSGMPLLAQRTISRQIEVVREIGRGRYGMVKLGKWRDENVALKIFFSKDEDSWFRETEIYQTVMLRHENILGFIAADISGADSWTQLFLITEYHENGSLYDYLHGKSLDVAEALKLAYTACCGLAHLHTEITGTQGKPAIAHRDVKSKNILVKRDGQCCIADMGLAVQYSRLTGKVNIGSYDKSRRQGTHRYMAPEVIMQSYHPDSFDAYKASDVYSFSLVLWEIANRTMIKGQVEEYHPPYYDVVGCDPDIDVMKKVVVVENIRPEVLPEWSCHEKMNTYVTVMQECWVARYESRLAMLRVRKTLHALHEGCIKLAEESTTTSDSDRKPSASSTSLSASSNTTPENPLIIPPEPPIQSTFVV